MQDSFIAAGNWSSGSWHTCLVLQDHLVILFGFHSQDGYLYPTTLAVLRVCGQNQGCLNQELKLNQLLVSWSFHFLGFVFQICYMRTNIPWPRATFFVDIVVNSMLLKKSGPLYVEVVLIEELPAFFASNSLQIFSIRQAWYLEQIQRHVINIKISLTYRVAVEVGQILKF